MLRKPRNERLIPGLLVLSFCMISLEVIYVMVYDGKKARAIGASGDKDYEKHGGNSGIQFYKDASYYKRIVGR